MRPVALHRDNLFLIGLMGSGKTTLGKQLARRLGKTFFDSDVVLETRLGVSIPTIFEIEGEAAFRDREELVIADLTTHESIVLATGGGAVLRAGNRARLREGGTVLYLHATPETLYERVRRSRNRPLLKGTDPLTRLRQLYGERDALYRETAAMIVESDRDQPSRVMHRIEALLSGRPAPAVA
jgi:shikimate kinase